MRRAARVNSHRGQILIALREKVLRGEFSARKRIEEVELSKNLGASRPAIHAALEALSHEGLVEELHAGGFTARNFTDQDISDAIEARGALEALAAGLAARRVTDPAQLEKARRINSELAEVTASFSSPSESGQRTAEQMARFGELNGAFHTALVSLAHSPLLQLSLKRVQSIAFASPAAVVVPAEPNRFSRAVDEHAEILDAIEARDAERAERLTREHARLALIGLRSALTRSGYVQPKAKAAADDHGAIEKTAAQSRTRAAIGRARSTGAAGPTGELVLDAAADLFCEKGFNETTTREIAARLNIHQASLYYHMSGKEDLLYRISKLTLETLLQGVRGELGKTSDPHSGLRVLIGAHLKGLFEYPNRALAMISEYRALSKAHQKELAAARRDYSNLLDAEIEKAANLEIVRNDIPVALLRLALLNYLNWTPRWFRSGGALSLDDLAGIYETVFLGGIAAPGQSRLPVADISSQRRTRPGPNHSGTLGKFVRIAAELFSRQGYASTSTRAISKLIGMEKATLYYHVKSKEDLLYLISKSCIEMLHEDVDKALEGTTTPLEQLSALVREHCCSLLRAQTQHATALAEARSLSPPRLAEIVALRKTYQSRVRSIIEAGQKQGSIRADIEPRYLASMLRGLLDWTVVWYRKSGSLTPAELADRLCELYLYGAQNAAASQSAR
jgi:DNA-binding GntR family transcriptional regulator/AcrR family transcriptional regulator